MESTYIVDKLIRTQFSTLPHTAKAKDVFIQSAHLYTLSITNQNRQTTIENEEKIAFHPSRK